MKRELQDPEGKNPAKVRGGKLTREERFRVRLEEIMVEVRKYTPRIADEARWYKAQSCG